MKKDDVEHEEEVGYKIVPAGYSHCSSIGFEESYFSYRCSVDREIRKGIINPIKNLIVNAFPEWPGNRIFLKQCIRERYNIK